MRGNGSEREAVTRELVETWVAQWQHHAHVMAIKTQLGHKDRILIDKFLLESLVYEFILENSARGVVVPSHLLLTKYVRLWSYRPRTQQIDAHLKRLQDKPTTRKNWCRLFRRRWSLTWGVRKTKKTLSSGTLKRKAVLSFGSPECVPQLLRMISH